MITNYLPWQTEQWQQLKKAQANHLLPHALMFVGPNGVGKETFAIAFAQSLMCQQPDANGLSCGSCRHCQLLQAGNHPDWIAIQPEGKNIKIDQIRALTQTLSKTRQLANYQIAIITPADALNQSAANALLKTLEEPAGNVLIILITDAPNHLPATVRSRCQTVRFPIPNMTQALAWLNEQQDYAQWPLLLKLAQGCPLKASSLLEEDELAIRQQLFEGWYDWIQGKQNLVKLVDQWNKLEITKILSHLSSWIADLIYIGQAEKNRVINYDLIDHLEEISLNCNAWKLHQYYIKLLNATRFATSSVNLNTQMQIEDILISWGKLQTA